ncbi:hypothetical protein [Archaeoglobus neptunius]|uniref:hypothetical protein n=1 Tax=Archaeoglobus neptunius TaxID=2798580 RepID=UPI001926CB21|nr:hypothetical protein [Archaeoglobus neptunius]
MKERIESIAREMCKKYEVNEEEVKSKLTLLIAEYKVPEKEAVKAIVNQILKDRETSVKPIDTKLDGLETLHEGELANVTVRVVKVYEGDGRRPSAALVGDETGMCRVVWWSRNNKVSLENNKCYRIEGARVVEFRGRKELQILETTNTEEVDVKIKLPDNKTEFTGVIVDTSRNSGLIPTCPKCGRHAPKKSCPEHGKIKPTITYKVRLTLDDGERCISALFNDELVEKLTGISKKEALQMAKAELNLDVVRERIDEALFGKYITVKGRKIRDTILVDEFEFVKDEPTETQEYEIEEEVIDFTDLLNDTDSPTDELISILEDEEKQITEER